MLSSKKRGLCIFFAAALYAACFPAALRSPDLVPPLLSTLLVWVAWVPFLFAVDWRRPRAALRDGFLFAAAANFLVLFWVFVAFKHYGGMSAALSALILFLMILVLSPFSAAAAYLTARFARTPAQRVWLGAVFFALLEEAKTLLPFGGFPWVSPAYALDGALPLIQALDLFGLSGFHCLIFAANFALAERLRGSLPRPLAARWAAGLAGAIVVLLGYGTLRLREVDGTVARTQPLTAALIQGNISQDRKWSALTRQEILDTYDSLSRSAVAKESVDLVVWPEASLPFLVRNDIAHAPIETGFLPEGAGLVFGAATSRPGRGKTQYVNSAFYVDRGGAVVGRYDKRHLVPFGEYVPLERWISRIVPAVAGNFSAGDDATVFDALGRRFGTLICYEALFAGLARDLVRGGAEFLVNITNDAWFDDTSGPYQHAGFARFRAIETRRSILRAANTGVSLWTDPAGRAFDATDVFRPDVVFAKAYPSRELTFYVRFPWLLPFLLLALAAAAILRDRRKA